MHAADTAPSPTPEPYTLHPEEALDVPGVDSFVPDVDSFVPDVDSFVPGVDSFHYIPQVSIFSLAPHKGLGFRV
jgi:hypothetical protein